MSRSISDGLVTASWTARAIQQHARTNVQGQSMPTFQSSTTQERMCEDINIIHISGSYKGCWLWPVKRRNEQQRSKTKESHEWNLVILWCESSRGVRNLIFRRVAFQMFIVFSGWVSLRLSLCFTLFATNLRYYQGTGHCDHSQSSDQLSNA